MLCGVGIIHYAPSVRLNRFLRRALRKRGSEYSLPSRTNSRKAAPAVGYELLSLLKPIMLTVKLLAEPDTVATASRVERS
jgi:hypothetical protein